MSPSGNWRKSLAFRRSLQVDHPLLPQLKLEVYGNRGTRTGDKILGRCKVERVGHLCDLLAQGQRLYMATNSVSIHGIEIPLEPSLDGKEPTAF